MMSERRPGTRAPSLWPFKARDDFITIVDLGAQKIACAIVCLSSPRFGLDVGARNIRVVGSAVVRSAGFAGGRIVNLSATETSIRRAVSQAEAQAGITAEHVVVTGQFHGLAAEIFEARLGSGARGLLKQDLEAISSAAEAHCAAAKRKLLHVFTAAADYHAGDVAVDPWPSDETEVIAVSMPLQGARQIAACLSRSLLAVGSYIAGPLATALAVTNPIERSVGVFVVDLGAQATGYALFSRGVPVFMECLASGGQQITEDLARRFALRKFEAERLKTRYGSIYDGLQADVDLPVVNGETGEPISKFSVNQCIRSNVSSLLKAINRRLKGAGYCIPAGGVVLAGGGSLLPGVREFATQQFAADVKTAKPVVLNGLDAGSALCALVGGCLYASRHHTSAEMAHASEIASQDSSYASRIGQWLRASF